LIQAEEGTAGKGAEEGKAGKGAEEGKAGKGAEEMCRGRKLGRNSSYMGQNNQPVTVKQWPKVADACPPGMMSKMVY
jgi:hypothetical protein